MTVGILTEKPSAARNFAAALGGSRGNYQGEDYVIAAALGHLYEFVEPHKMVDTALQGQYQKWNIQNLPWNPADMSWQHAPTQGSDPMLNDIKNKLGGCDEIVIATDVDPTGEGELLAWLILDGLGLRPTTWSRMYFTDEVPASLQKAFPQRKTLSSKQTDGDYRKALYRSQFDLLSMQWTRVATSIARESGQQAVLRQGRLKSAMVKLVGDQLKAYDDYVKRTFFQNRFHDENCVTYINPDEPRFDRHDQVPQRYSASTVVLDRHGNKRKAPPKLLDLAALSSILVGMGIPAKTVLSTYQKLYEQMIVSYPRTEDHTITPEQFKELSPQVDEIAAVVGVDASLLTHREPRKTHVKATGAHGANRPGPKVPASLGALKDQFGLAAPLIYQTLAKNYLAMLAGDYVYERQEGHVEAYPDFTGAANVPKDLGWKQVFDPDADDPAATDKDEAAQGLGTLAEPFIFEGANKRPEHPSMRWLMKQLQKRDVGTGATRTSTYSEVTSSQAKYPLLVEKRGKLSVSEFGRMSWLLLPGTKIGELSLTEHVYDNMRAIAAGSTTGERCLAEVAGWVRDDIAQMQQNAHTMRSELGLKRVAPKVKYEGVWDVTGATVAFNRSWGRHDFSDDECARLLAGEEISFEATSHRTGNTYTATGRLAEDEHNGRTFVGFQRAIPEGPRTWCKHVFTNGEKAALLAGNDVFVTGFVSSKGNIFDAAVRWDDKAKKIEPNFDAATDAPPHTWCKHTFTPEEKDRLSSGEAIYVEGFISRKGNTFDAKVRWTENSGKKKIIPEFA